MSSTNDLELGEKLSEVIRCAGKINALARDRRELQLFHILDVIEDAARKAKWRLNDLKLKEMIR